MRRTSFFWLSVLIAAWWLLTAPDLAWEAGLLAVIVGALLHYGLGGRGAARLTVPGLLRFLPFFLHQMVRGGLDVSRRALSPSLPLAPDLFHFRTGLPEGLPRVFFINAISLLPGTFSAQVDRDDITVHRLDSAMVPEARLRTLEAKVAGLFGLESDLESSS
ncbi:MAG: Na+/H+ antiporter subunit E [Longimicrobiales bacterium]